jgi:excisionase family DNA binding protein
MTRLKPGEQMEDVMDKLLLRIPEVAQILACGRTTVYGLVNSGELPTVYIGKRGVRIPAESVDDFVTRLRQVSGA